MKRKIFGAVLLITALICLFFLPGEKDTKDLVVNENPVAVSEEEKAPVISDTPAKAEAELQKLTEEPDFKVASEEKEIKENKEIEVKEQAENKPAPDSLKKMYDNINPEALEDIPIIDKEHTCTLSVRCDTISGKMDKYGDAQGKVIPTDGIIYPEKQVVFYEGESVFNLLLREMKINRIHLEFVNTPLYKTAYIEGINNIYEFDFGELSGWMYRVNGVFPRYGCSSYLLKDGDCVEWVYTCDFGKDVGDNYIE